MRLLSNMKMRIFLTGIMVQISSKCLKIFEISQILKKCERSELGILFYLRIFEFSCQKSTSPKPFHSKIHSQFLKHKIHSWVVNLNILKIIKISEINLGSFKFENVTIYMHVTTTFITNDLISKVWLMWPALIANYLLVRAAAKPISKCT